MLEDFDYIGNGGFVIECKDGDVLGLTKDQADVVQRECPFFESCFRHDMVERQCRVLRKPDWTLAIARHLIEALTKGRTALPTLNLYEEFMQAGDQAILDLRLCNFVNYMDPTNSKDHRFLELVSEKYHCFKLTANVTSYQWLKLLDEDILLNRETTNYVVQVDGTQKLSEDQLISKEKLDTRTSEYAVHAEFSVGAIMQIRKVLKDKASSHVLRRSTNHPGSPQESFSIYFETTQSIPKDHHELIDRLAGGEAYIRTCADAAEFQTEGYTVRASLDVLLRSIEPLQVSETDIECSLRIDNPTPDTLGRFVNACHRAETYPGTLGLDATINRYFCRKSLRDVYFILCYMADYSTSGRIETSFSLYELSSEDKAF